ncbi:MAG: transcriptional regulator, partial [Candidatus Dormibacteraeota bacterium]|nr:transcriptional regulator [Candidatus Dormibacteraeota bacterium]
PDQMSGRLAQDIEAISLLGDPVRRRVYFSVPPAPGFTDRDFVSIELGISRNLAAFHLDKLAGRGLLDVTYRRLSGKTGRGAGRPRKLYQRSQQDVSVNLPQRNYSLLAHLLAATVEEAGRQSRNQLARAARARGAELGRAALAAVGGRSTRQRMSSVILDTLFSLGYEPHLEGRTVYMRNCPFDGLKRDHRDLVCTTNQDLMVGLLKSLGPAGLEPRFEPAENRCCVVLRPAQAA